MSRFRRMLGAIDGAESRLVRHVVGWASNGNRVGKPLRRSHEDDLFAGQALNATYGLRQKRRPVTRLIER